MKARCKNIWFLSAYDQPLGLSARTDHFAEYFSEKGFKVTFITNNFCHFKKNYTRRVRFLWSNEKIKKYKVIWLKTSKYSSNTGLGRVLNMWQNAYKTFIYGICCKNKPSIIIAPSVPISLGFIGCLLAKRFKCKMVYEIRDLWPQALVDVGAISKTSFTFYVMRYMEKFIYKNSSAIVSTLPFVRNHLKKTHNKKYLIKVIPNGIKKQNQLKLNKNKFVKKPNQPFKIMYFGGFGLDHDVHSIIIAAKYLEELNPGKYKFFLFGSGPKKNVLIQLCEKNNLKNIKFFKPTKQDNIPKVASGADLLIAAITNSPSYKFGLNLNKICTYFCSFRPILFSGNVKNNPVSLAKAGASVPAESPEKLALAIQKICLTHPNKKWRMALNGYKFAKNNLCIERLGNEYLGLIKKILEKE